MGRRWTGQMVDPGGEIAPDLQLASLLRARIETGELPPGTKLPSIIQPGAAGWLLPP